MNSRITSLAKTVFRGLGLDVYRLPRNCDSSGTWSNPPSSIRHSIVRTGATYSPWLTDSDFQVAYQKIKHHTLVDIHRCYELWTLAKQLSAVDGDILEVGVWRGGTGAILAEAVKAIPSKTVYLADTFAGVVKAGENDTSYRSGEHADTSLDMVKELVKSMNLKNVTLLQGMFPEDTADRISGSISLLHCDVDVYQSSKDTVEWCLPRLSTGGVIIFDDYGFSGCEGVTKYCEELRSHPDFRFMHNLNGHAIFTKLK